MEKTEGGLDVYDVGGLNKVSVRMTVFFEDREKPIWARQDSPEIPEEYVAKLEELVGDGNATVTVGLDVKTSVDFGNSAGCSVFVKLTCGQDESSVSETAAVAQSLAVQYLEPGWEEAALVLRRCRGQDEEEEPPEIEVVQEHKVAPASAKKVIKKAPDKAKPGDGKRKLKIAGSGVGKPSFRKD